MDILKCKAFVTAADEGSFTAAGKIMGYTPSGISQLVSAAEKEFGFSLLVRKSNGVVLTREGEYLYPLVMDYIEKENAIYKAATELSGMYKGNVMIAQARPISHSCPGLQTLPSCGSRSVKTGWSLCFLRSTRARVGRLFLSRE